MTLEDLNALDQESAERELLRCCGASRWARAVESTQSPMGTMRSVSSATGMNSLGDTLP